MTKAGRKYLRNDNGASQIAEFAPVLYVLFILVLMPLLDLASTFVAGATQYLATNDFVAKASTQPDYSSALNTMANEAYQFQGTGLAQFVHMAPAGGYTGCGDDLYLLTTDIGSGAQTSSAANQPLSQAINTKTSMYEMSVRSQYSVAPLVSLAAVPLLGEIPGLGKPMEFVFVANRPAEHPGGLQPANSGNSSTSSAAVVPFPRVPSNPASATATNITWRTPNIYQMIQAAGETVVGQGVFIVYAKNINWTLTYLNVSPGQKIWIDTQAVGSWNIKPWAGIPSTDANGVSNPSTYGATGPDGAPYSAPGQPMGCLAGKIASSTPFFLGDDKYNYPPVGSGAFSMICNDWASALNYNDNTGYQYVRVIVVE